MEISNPSTIISFTAIWIIVLSGYIVMVKQKHIEKHKKMLFFLFAIPTMLATLYLAGNTIHHNIQSETGGPIHWHADYDIYVCGEKLNLVDPTGFLNKIGTPLFHEHDDHRIHVEGTVSDIRDVDVGSYFETVGGKITATSLQYPNNDGRMISVKNGDLCNGQPAELAVYVNGQRIEDPENYMYYPHPGVPPGDCIIVLFEPNPKETISSDDYLCPFWKSAGWNYENFKEKRKEPNNEPSWKDPNWKYIDGKGLVRVNNG
jgi:hypothetical protein